MWAVHSHSGFFSNWRTLLFKGLMNETRIASTAMERRAGAGDSCAGDCFTSRSCQSEGMKGPNPGKPGSHPLDTNPNRVPVIDANMEPSSMMTVPCLSCGINSAKIVPCSHLQTVATSCLRTSYITEVVARLSWSGIGLFGTFLQVWEH
jgi:hypothetical protein